MSPRAAARLETLGFTRVYDYVGGKADWFAAGLPREGRLASAPRAGDRVRHHDVVCRLSDPLGEIADRLRDAGEETCPVVNAEGIVLGRVRGSASGGAIGGTVEEVMEPGPTTVRPNTMLESILERLRARNLDSVLVTTSDGRLVGTLDVEDAESRPDDDERSCMCEE